MSRTIRSFMKRKSFLMSLAGVVTVSSFTSLISTAHAKTPNGSLALSDLDSVLLNQSPQLQQEIKQALKAAKKDDVGCFAPLLRRPFNELNNSRVAPFTCLFPKNKSLTIQANTFARLPDGKTIPLAQFLDRKSVPEGVSLQFELTTWKWTNGKR